MLGGGEGKGKSVFPGFADNNQVQYGNNSMPQLQLFAHVPVKCDVGAVNIITNQYVPNASLPHKRVVEGEPAFRQQKVCRSLNNSYSQDEVARSGTLFNPKHVSTGLRLFCEEERNSSVTFGGENRNSSSSSVLGNNIKLEVERQTEEYVQHIKLQEENFVNGVRELTRRHKVSLLNALEKEVNGKLHEKELEIENINRKNKELEDRIKQVSMDAQSWQYRANYNESVINVLKSNIQQLVAQGNVQFQEGMGESDMEDTASCSNRRGVFAGPHNQAVFNHQLACKACQNKEMSVLLIPCRHLCLCIECAALVDICPVCQVKKTGNFQVVMS